MAMTFKVGDRLPDAKLLRLGENGPEAVELAPKLAGRKVVIFAVPGAFTPTCSNAHVPSFIRTADRLREKGVDEIICISVNDPFVMKAWDEATGAGKAGITMLGDADSSFTEALGLAFDAPAAGLYRRSRRYAMVADDGVVTVFNLEPDTDCSVSAGEAILEAL
jgi:peroxiredoxin